MDYCEIILGSVQTLVDAAISKIEVDQTIVATIIDDSDSKNGHYKVKSKEAVVYDAYTEDKALSKNTQVYLLIPKDKNMRNAILGRYIVEEAEAEKYVSYREKLVPTGKNLYTGGGASLIANSNTEYVELTNFNLAELKGSAIHDTIYLKGDFRSLLVQDTVSQGNYGLLLVLKNANKYIEMKLDSSDMFGNPYAFSGYFTQEKILKYSSEEDFTAAQLYFYQDKNFKTIDNDTGIETELTVSDTANLFVQNIEIIIGYNTEEIDNHTVKIFTYDDKLYSATATQKKISLIWYNKTEDNEYLGFSDGIFDTFDKAKGAPTITDGEEAKKYYWIEWHVDDRTGVPISTANGQDNLTNYTVECQSTLSSTNVYASIWLNGTEYKSNTLTFENQQVKSNSINNLGITLKIEHDTASGSRDLYSFYGENNHLIDNSQAYKKRKVKLSWTAQDNAIVEKTFWADAVIKWYLPKHNTMLKPINPKESLSSDSETEYMFQTRLGTLGMQDNLNGFEYYIKDYYYRNFTNNTIRCVIELPNNTGKAEASLTLAFSSTGNSGTSYTLAVVPEGREFGFTNTSGTSTWWFKASLTNAEGQSVNGDFNWKRQIEQANENTQSGPSVQYTFNINDYNVLEVSSEQEWAGQPVILTTLFPVTYSENGKYYAQAPTHIIYDSFGKLSSIDFPPLKLFKTVDNTEVAGVVWEIGYRDSKNEIQTFNDNDVDKSWLPQIQNNTIQPALMYGDTGYYSILNAKVNINNTATVVWSQPLIVQQYKYGSSLLNNWDGSLKIDSEGNTIMAAMMGAGKKDEDNTFSGVVMGELAKVEKVEDEKRITNSATGLIGYYCGKQAFGFKDDGTAFIGQSGQGRIEFDGTSGVIQSQGWTISKDEHNNYIYTYANGDDNEGKGSIWNLANGDFILQKDNEHLKFTDNGLDIKVNNLSITSGIGENLLLNTNPIDPEEQAPWAISNAGFIYPEIGESSEGKIKDLNTSWKKYVAVEADDLEEWNDDNGNYFITDNVLCYELPYTNPTDSTTWFGLTIESAGLGTTFTVTVDIAYSSNDEIPESQIEYYIRWDDDEESWGQQNVSNQIQIDGQWNTVSHTFTRPVTPNALRILVGVKDENSQGGTLYVRNFSVSSNLIEVDEAKGTLFKFVTTSPSQYLYQSISNLPKGSYTLSCEAMAFNEDKKISLGAWNIDTQKLINEQVFVVNQDSFTKIHMTFENEQLCHVAVGFGGHSSGSSFKVRHPKLESGIYATQWIAAQSDTTSYIQGVEYLNQDKVFEKLTNNGTVEGIWLENGQLYINATYIATGVLSSTAGDTRIDLDTGKIEAKQLTLDAGDWEDGRLFLSNSATAINEPSASNGNDEFFQNSYFALGTNNNYLAFSQKGFRLQLYNQAADSGISFNSDDTAGLVITSNNLSIRNTAGYNLSSGAEAILIWHEKTELASFNKNSITLQNSGASLSNVQSSKSLSGVYLYPHWGGASNIFLYKNSTDNERFENRVALTLNGLTPGQKGYLAPSATKVNGRYPVYYKKTGDNTANVIRELATNDIVNDLSIGYVTGEYGNWLISNGTFTINYTEEGATTQGSSLQLSDAGYMFFAQSNEGDEHGSILIGNIPNSEYALQIGTFKVKWSGEVEMPATSTV